MPYKDPARKKASGKLWWKRNRKEQLIRLRLRYRTHRKEHLKQTLAYYYAHRATSLPKHQKYRRKLRTEVLEKLGNKCCKCGFLDWRALQVDHKRGGGYNARKQKEKGYIALHRNVLKHGSKKYQLLCANCNWIKRWTNKEFGGVKRK